MSEVGKDLMQSVNEVLNGETRTFVEVVRCKDCKYWDEYLVGYCSRNDCYGWDENDFCSRGEKR